MEILHEGISCFFLFNFASVALSASLFVEDIDLLLAGIVINVLTCTTAMQLLSVCVCENNLEICML